MTKEESRKEKESTTRPDVHGAQRFVLAEADTQAGGLAAVKCPPEKLASCGQARDNEAMQVSPEGAEAGKNFVAGPAARHHVGRW